VIAAMQESSPKIPVANLLRVVFYARHMLEDLEDCQAARADGAAFEGILQAMLVRASSRLRLRGFERGYWPNSEVTARPRGRVLFSDSIAYCTIPTKRLACAFDDYGVDTPNNRMLKACAKTLARCEASLEYQDSLRALVREMRDVSDVILSRTFLRTLPRSPTARRYRLTRFIARIIVESGQPDENMGGEWARRLEQDEIKMRAVFERFVYNYADQHAPRDVRVHRKPLPWGTGNPNLVGGLNTDVTVRGKGWSRIIECKYTRSAIREDHRGKQMFHPEHLRQIYAYLARTRDTAKTPIRVDGVLLYPALTGAAEDPIDLGGFAVRVVRLPLSAPWSELTGRLEQVLFGNEDAR
jgi:5-methylcytosine-specific restriction endonuclease McrBC regulatory subunit McrC